MSAWRARPEAARPGVEVWGFAPETPAAPLSIRIDPHGPPAASAEVKRAWANLCAANPRLHDGPVLSVVWFDAEEASMLTRPDTYQRLAVQPRVATGVRMLGVTALLATRDEEGRERLMLGRRGESTRIYGGLWELGPAGGLDSWHPGQLVIDPAAVVEQAADEVEEEAGLEVSGGSIVGVVRDDTACSYDVVVRIEVERCEARAARADGWEYSAIAWLAREEAPAFLANEPVIEPTRAVLRALGWGGPAR